MKFSNLLGFEKEVLAMPSHRSVVVDDALDTYCLLGLAGSWQLLVSSLDGGWNLLF